MHKNTKILFSLGALFLLNACSAPAMNITSKPVGIQKSTEYISEGVTEIQPVEVRTYSRPEGTSQDQEIADITCEVKGRGYSAEVITPGIVNIPVYGQKSSSVSAHCNSATLAGTGVGQIVNFDLEQRQAATQNAGIYGGFVGSIIASGIASGMKAREGDRFAYKTVAVKLISKPTLSSK